MPGESSSIRMDAFQGSAHQCQQQHNFYKASYLLDLVHIYFLFCDIGRMLSNKFNKPAACKRMNRVQTSTAPFSSCPGAVDRTLLIMFIIRRI